VGDVLGAGDFNLIARIDAKTPRVLPVVVEACRGSSHNCKSDEGQGDPLQPVRGSLGKRSAPDRDALLSAQKWGFLLRFQIDEPCVVEGLTLGSLVLRNAGKRIQFFLYHGRT
jgi:hypothetical protein